MAEDTGNEKDQKDAPDKGDETDWKAEADKWKAMSRKHEAQAKENAAELAKLAAAGDASKSDAEKAAARLAELESKVHATELRAMRAEVAGSKGLTAAQARRLQGSTVEELEADADDLLASFKPADKADDDADTATQGSGKPKEKLRGGASNADDENLELDPTKLAEQIGRL